MKSFSLKLFPALSLLLLSAPVPGAVAGAGTATVSVSTRAAAEPTSAVRELVEEAKRYKDENEKGISAEEKKKRLEAKAGMSAILNLREMSRLILKNHWAKLKETERKKYSDLMSALVEKIGYPQISKYFNGEIEIGYEGEKSLPGGDYAVLTRIVYKSEDLTLSTEFHAHKTASGWRIYDVLTDGDSLLLIYRNQHMGIIKEKGFPHLIKLMEKKLRGGAKSEK